MSNDSKEGDIVSLDHYRADRMIQQKLLEAFSFVPGIENIIDDMLAKAKVGDKNASENLMVAVQENLEGEVLRILSEDPVAIQRFSETLVEMLGEELIDFDAPLEMDPPSAEEKAAIHLLQARLTEEEMFLFESALSEAQTEGSAEALERARALAPTYFEVHLAEASHHSMRGTLRKALVAVAEAEKCCPGSPRVGVFKAGLLREIGDCPSALRELDVVIEANDWYAKAYRERGQIRLITGDLTGAREDFEWLSEHKPSADDWYNLGNVHSGTADWEAAVNAYQNAVEMNPRDAQGYCDLGFAWSELAKVDLAFEAWEEASGIDPFFPLPYAGRAAEYIATQDHFGALGESICALMFAPEGWASADEVIDIFEVAAAAELTPDGLKVAVLSGRFMDAGAPEVALEFLDRVTRIAGPISPDLEMARSQLRSVCKDLPSAPAQEAPEPVEQLSILLTHGLNEEALLALLNEEHCTFRSLGWATPRRIRQASFDWTKGDASVLYFSNVETNEVLFVLTGTDQLALGAKLTSHKGIEGLGFFDDFEDLDGAERAKLAHLVYDLDSFSANLAAPLIERVKADPDASVRWSIGPFITNDVDRRVGSDSEFPDWAPSDMPPSSGLYATSATSPSAFRSAVFALGFWPLEENLESSDGSNVMVWMHPGQKIALSWHEDDFFQTVQVEIFGEPSESSARALKKSLALQSLDEVLALEDVDLATVGAFAGSGDPRLVAKLMEWKNTKSELLVARMLSEIPGDEAESALSELAQNAGFRAATEAWWALKMRYDELEVELPESAPDWEGILPDRISFEDFSDFLHQQGYSWMGGTEAGGILTSSEWQKDGSRVAAFSNLELEFWALEIRGGDDFAETLVELGLMSSDDVLETALSGTPTRRLRALHYLTGFADLPRDEVYPALHAALEANDTSLGTAAMEAALLGPWPGGAEFVQEVAKERAQHMDVALGLLERFS